MCCSPVCVSDQAVVTLWLSKTLHRNSPEVIFKNLEKITFIFATIFLSGLIVNLSCLILTLRWSHICSVYRISEKKLQDVIKLLYYSFYCWCRLILLGFRLCNSPFVALSLCVWRWTSCSEDSRLIRQWGEQQKPCLPLSVTPTLNPWQL